MSDSLLNQTETFAKLQLVLKAAQAKVEELELARTQPIAVIGMACRFPGGAHSPEQLWALLAQGADLISDLPAGRWARPDYLDPDPEIPGKICSTRGGFLSGDVYGFDPHFFGLTPEEALSMDPQHRLLLEVAWEALENAGLEVPGLKGTKTGVFAGLSTGDYSRALLHSGDWSRLDPYSMIGGAAHAGPGRISRLLGLEGPSLAVDTAESSSLVAVHLACQSLRSGESRLALAGGANLILSPDIAIGYSRLQSLAPAGCCQVFDAAADGPVRGEGCGLLVLQNFADALRDGNPVLALILGSAVNQNGSGEKFAAPSQRIQQNLFLEALRQSALSAHEVQYVEAHGAATGLADAAEIQSLAGVYGRGRTARNPLWVGSVKASLGNLEAAAGSVGLIKTILQLGHRAICPQVHWHRPNPNLPWPEVAIKIPARLADWPAADSARTAAVSAFGVSGTNAHVILREAPLLPLAASMPAPMPAPNLLVLSARGPAALRAMALDYAAFLERTTQAEGPGLVDLCFSSALSRAGLESRLAVMGKTRDELRGKLNQWAAGQACPGVWSSVPGRTWPPRLAFLFTGQGSQYRQMGRDLWESQPVFQAVLRQCDQILKPQMEFGLLDLIYNQAAPDDQLHQTLHTQPVIFAFGYALAKMWEAWGAVPSAVLGHSIGEVAAACFAGVITLEDALGLVALRGRLIQRATQPGMMGAIVASPERVAAAIRELGGQVSIAAINAPENVVISGQTAAVKQILEHFKNRDIPSLALRISHAIHSPLMDSILDEYRAAAARITFSLPRIPLISNLTGRLAGPEITRPDYWCSQLRQTVNFRACLETLRDSGCQIALETGSTSILSSLGLQSLPGSDLLWLHTLGPKNSLFNMRPQRLAGRSDWETIWDTLGQLYARGADLDWRQIHGGSPGRRVRLPNYPFQRQSYRLETARPQPATTAAGQMPPALR